VRIPTAVDSGTDPSIVGRWIAEVQAEQVAAEATLRRLGGVEIAKYRAGRWTWPLVAVNAVLDLAFAVPVIWLLLTDRQLNPDLVQRFEWLREGGAQDVARIAVVVTAAITLWDVANCVVKAGRSAARDRLARHPPGAGPGRAHSCPAGAPLPGQAGRKPPCRSTPLNDFPLTLNDSVTWSRRR
jgi:hypothetical protein